MTEREMAVGIGKEPAPFASCPALSGYHCWSNSIAKIYHHYGLPLSEEMLFGLGAGIGFMYWEQKGAPPFIGGRDNIKSFAQDIGMRTGVGVIEKSTSQRPQGSKNVIGAIGKGGTLAGARGHGPAAPFRFS